MIVSVRFSVCFADINHFDGALIISRVSQHPTPCFPYFLLLNIVARICNCCRIRDISFAVSFSGNDEE